MRIQSMMPTTGHSDRTSGFKVASGLLAACAISAWLVFAPASGAAEKKKKADEVMTTAPGPKKKTYPKAAPKPAPDKKGETTSGPSAASKSKVARSTPEPEPNKREKETEAEHLRSAATAPTAAITPEELVEFHAQPASVKKLIESSLELARQNLAYTFGSSDPATGGLDCSGFIHFILRQHGFTQVPRDSSGQYSWVRHTRGFRAVISRKADSFEMDELLPGDLLFWTGTYATPNDPPISHVMLYLGTEKSTDVKVMVGASDGRTYHGQKRNGVSVFDFLMPRSLIEGDQRATFIGYGRIPGLRE